jgi:osmotically-inducible protein OsmY
MTRTDSEIKHAVLEELKWDTRVHETDVGVEVDAGVVTLTGTVSSYVKRMAAEQAAHRVAGVLDVANNVAVKLQGSALRTDTDIAAAVRQTLQWDALVPDERIRSTVSGGWVTLEGDVDYLAEREDAERAIRNLAGVQGISNRIEVKPAKSDEVAKDVRRSIESALERRADRHARRLEVTVSNGRVILKGTVHSLPEREAVVHAVSATAGVRRVDAHLLIDPYTA